MTCARQLGLFFNITSPSDLMRKFQIRLDSTDPHYKMQFRIRKAKRPFNVFIEGIKDLTSYTPASRNFWLKLAKNRSFLPGQKLADEKTDATPRPQNLTKKERMRSFRPKSSGPGSGG
jgi:hypothetical protein